MKLRAYSVRDAAVEAFLPPFFMRAPAEAVRSFSAACSDGQTAFCKSPQDFALYFVGWFDDVSGKFDPVDQPEQIVTAFEAIKNARNVVDGDTGVPFE